MFDCFICSEKREDTNFWTCEQCSKSICLHCFEQITTGERPRCPYCRMSLSEEEDEVKWYYPFDVSFYSQEIIPLTGIDLSSSIRNEYIRLPTEDYNNITQLLEQQNDSPMLQALNALLQQYMPTTDTEIEN